MKITRILAACLIAGAATVSATAADPNVPLRFVTPGPVIAGSVDMSQLPADAVKYLDKYFNGVKAMEIDREYLAGKYDVQMADGTEIDFDSKGKVVEIDAPDGYALDVTLLKSILPADAVKFLEKNRQACMVEKVERKRSTYEVDLADRDETQLRFDHRGKLFGITYDD